MTDFNDNLWIKNVFSTIIKAMNLFKKRSLFLFASFVAGFSIMTIEFTATRTIIPYVGASVYTWTSVIGVILLGLAIGSLVGGYIIDKYKRETTLSLFLFLSSFLVAFVPFFANKTPFLVSLDLSVLNTILLISLILFFAPAFF